MDGVAKVKQVGLGLCALGQLLQDEAEPHGAGGRAGKAHLALLLQIGLEGELARVLAQILERGRRLGLLAGLALDWRLELRLGPVHHGGLGDVQPSFAIWQDEEVRREVQVLFLERARHHVLQEGIGTRHAGMG